MSATTSTPSPALFTFKDMHAGRCTFEQVGEPIPEPEPEPTPDIIPEALPALPDMSDMSDAEIAQTAVRLLREATVEVFHRLGAGDWLYQLARTDPKNFLKMLQRLLPQSIEATVTVAPFEVPKHIANLSIEDLRAMHNGAAGQQVIDADYVTIPRRQKAAPAA